MAFATSGELGVSLNTIYNAPNTTTNPENPGLPFSLGQTAQGTNGQRYIFVKCSGAVPVYACVCIDENHLAVASTNTLAAQANMVGWAVQNAAWTSGQYGWVATAGAGLRSRVKNAVAANAQLYTSASAGVLGTDASTGNPSLIHGVRTAAAEVSGSTVGATGFVATIVAVNPHFGTPAT